MLNQKSQTNRKIPTPLNNLEALKSDGDLNSFESPFFDHFKKEESKKKEGQKKGQEFNLFNYQSYYELELVKKKVKELVELIRQEVELIKKSNRSLLQEVSDVQKLTVEQLPQKPGIYHIRFLEIILNILRHLKEKIGESKTWLNALLTRKKKRGSLFLARSKKMGTQYSLSHELQVSRAIQ
jgi:hypothetical protein